MKKTYSKPELYAETFELACHIAVYCAGAAPGSFTYADRSYCGFYLGGQQVFNAGVCQLPIDAEEYGEDCYNGPFLETPGQPFGS